MSEAKILILSHNNSPVSLCFNFSDSVDITLEGDGHLYDNKDCTINPENAKTYTAGLKYIYFKTNSFSKLKINDGSKVIGLGSEDIYFNDLCEYKLSVNLDLFENLTIINLQNNINLFGVLPVNLTYLHLDNINWTNTEALPENLTYLYLNNVDWIYSGELPINLTHLHLNNIDWTYNGALPISLTYLHLGTVNWTYTGVLPSDLTHLYFYGDNIDWTYTGSLPINLISLYLNGSNIKWTYNGGLSTNLTYLYLKGNNIRWTYTGSLPINLTYLLLEGTNIYWIYTGTLPSNLIYLILDGNNICWTYTGALPTNLKFICLVGGNICWTYEGVLPTSLTDIHLNGNNIHWTYSGALHPNITYFSLYRNISWTYEGALPENLTYLALSGSNIHWTYEGALPKNLTQITLVGDNIHWRYNGALPNNIRFVVFNGSNINWTYAPWSFTNNFRQYYIVNTITPHIQEDIISVLNKAAKVTWVDYKNIYLPFPNASMADITQCSIWGDFSNIEDFKPSQLALDLKTLIKDKNVVVTLNGISMPTGVNDGTGFPENFGAWWNENYINILTYNNTPASLYFNFSDTVQVSIKGYGYLYDDASCITNPQSTKTYTAGLKYIYFKTDSISTIRISNKDYVIGLGDEGHYFNSNSGYKLKINLDFFEGITKIKLQNQVNLTGTLPLDLTYLYLDTVYWRYEKALPENLTYLHLYGNDIYWTYIGVLHSNPIDVHLNNVYWTYNKALPLGLTYLYLNGNNIHFTYEEAMPSGLTWIYLCGSSIHWICKEDLPDNLVYLRLDNINWIYQKGLPNSLDFFYLFGENISWTYSGALSSNLAELYLNGNNIRWTYAPWNFINGFRYYNINSTGIPHTQENIISVLDKAVKVTWVVSKYMHLPSPNANMADTDQGGIWGDFSNINNFQPSQTAIDLKTLVKTKNVIVILNGISMPDESGDGTGFPQNFGIWWRS